MKQTVYNRKLSNIQGFFVVMALVVVLIALNYLVIDVLAGLLGYTAASVGFWLVGIIVGLWVFHEFIEAYSYELGEDVLRLNRAYGKRTRHIEDIYLSRLVFIGTPEEAAAKNPQARRLNAYHKKCKIPQTAVVYDSSAGRRMAILQLNGEMLAELKKRMKEK